ncbi:peptidylprolyl isomerase [Methyloprofundus sp.]|uniref:peptidylprolyl isomerase n=1 Tax=Methyloprofundus sp. TaxID=2020875 RepID=UPI003D0A829A
MKKTIMIALCYSFASIAQAELVSDKQDNQVSTTSLEILLERAPAHAQIKLLKNKAQVKEQLEQLYLREVMAQMAIAEGLDKQGINAQRLKAIRYNGLFLLKLDEVRKENKRNYIKYAKQKYQVNKANYPVEARVDAAHILISNKTLSDAEALKKAQNIRMQLMQGANFTELAIKESDDKSVKKNKGEMGVFTRGQMVKPFSDAVFTMQVGEISEPVKTQYGYHIIKLNKKFPAGFKSFDDVKAQMISELKKKDWEIARTAYYEQLMKENDMQIDELALDEFISKKIAELESKTKSK